MITNNDEAAYREQVQVLIFLCQNNNLVLNTSKTKELVTNYRKHKYSTTASLAINGEQIHQVFNRCSFLRRPDLGGEHQAAGEEGPAETLLPAGPQENWASTETPHQPLPMHHRKCPELHSVVLQLLLRGGEQPAADHQE